MADFLIKAGADIELGCSTPLMEAAQEGHLELVKYLLAAGIAGASTKFNILTKSGPICSRSLTSTACSSPNYAVMFSVQSLWLQTV